MIRKLFLSVAVMFCAVGLANADLVGLWRFEEDVSPQPDSSGNGHSAAAENDVVWAADAERGGVMEFPNLGLGAGEPGAQLVVDDSDLLSIQTDDENGGALTIAAWALFETYDTWNSIVSKTGEVSTNKPSPYDVYTLNGGDGRVSLYVGEGNATIQQLLSEEIAELETWVHIAITLDADGEVTHYLNGEENGFGLVDMELNPLVDEDQPLFIGGRLDDVTHMSGRLDDVAIFNEALSGDQIKTIMGGDFSAFLGGVGGDGDWNGNGMLDVADIDALANVVIAGSNDPAFDLNGDSLVDASDHGIWVKDLKNTWFGDSNLDGEFNSADFVQVFQRGEYEDGTAGNSGWGDGDWNGDGDFDSSDFVAAFQDGGFEVGPRAATQSVPEPSAMLLLLLGTISVGLRARKR